MRVIIESPYKGDNYEELEGNIKYARICMRDSLLRGEYPIASHLIYTQEGILDDTIQEERILGIEAGLHWGEQAERTIVYMDYGISGGMDYGINKAFSVGRFVEYRSIL